MSRLMDSIDSSPTDIGEFISSPVSSTVSTDSDGFATVVIKDSIEPAIRFDANLNLEESEEESELEDESEFNSETEDTNHNNYQQQVEAEEDQLEESLESDEDEDEFPSLDDFPTTSISHSATSYRPQIGGEFDDDGEESSSDDDEDNEDEPQVTIETTQIISGSTGDLIDRVMQHHSMKFALEKPQSSFASTPIASSSMTAHERELILLRSMLQSDPSGALARMRQRASRELTETTNETRMMKHEQILMDDLLGLIPQDSEDERKQPSLSATRTIATNIHPSISPPARIASQQQQPIQRVIRMADEDDMDEVFREEAAMMAAEMSDSDEDRVNEDQSALEFSNLGSIDAAAGDEDRSASSVSTRANRYSQQDAISKVSHTSASKQSTCQLTPPSNIASPVVAPPTSIAPVITSARRGPPPGVPSAQMARQGVFLPENNATTIASSASSSASNSSSAAARAYPPTSAVDLPSNLFTSSVALSFLKFTPESAKKLQAQFAREQSEFKQRIEHTSAPDASIHVIAPAGRDELDPSMFKS